MKNIKILLTICVKYLNKSGTCYIREPVRKSVVYEYHMSGLIYLFKQGWKFGQNESDFTLTPYIYKGELSSFKTVAGEKYLITNK